MAPRRTVHMRVRPARGSVSTLHHRFAVVLTLRVAAITSGNRVQMSFPNWRQARATAPPTRRLAVRIT